MGLLIVACWMWGVPIRLFTLPGNVSVYINGNLFGMSDRTGVLSELLFLNAGVHTFQAEKPGYNGQTQVLNIQEATTVTLVLQPSGMLEVKAVPTDAVIRVDEQWDSAGTFKREVPVGRHYVEVSLKGFKTRYYYPEVQQYFTRTLEVTLEKEGFVRFVTQPTEVNVSVDGKALGVTPIQTYLEPGDHLVAYTKDWYYPQIQKIQIDSFIENQVFQTLEPFAHLTLQSTPTGAKAYLAQKYIGDTPITLSELAVGKVQIGFRKEGYTEQFEEILLAPGHTTIVKEMRLQEYLITVESTPAAMVYYDSVEKGITPMTFSSQHGSHILSLKSGEKEWWTEVETIMPRKVQVDLNAETTVVFHIIPAGAAFILHRGQKYLPAMAINTVAAIQTFDIFRSGYPDRRRVYKLAAGVVYEFTINLEGEASLFLSTDPEEARVFWMGTEIGFTPLRDQKVRPGSGELRVEWRGGEWTENISFFDGQTYTLYRKLPASTTLYIQSFPSGLPVWFDGSASGVTPVVLTARSGTHTIECERSDGSRQQQIITLSGDVERTINFVF